MGSRALLAPPPPGLECHRTPSRLALARGLSWAEWSRQKVAGSILRRATRLARGFDPWAGRVWEARRGFPPSLHSSRSRISKHTCGGEDWKEERDSHAHSAAVFSRPRGAARAPAGTALPPPACLPRRLPAQARRPSPSLPPSRGAPPGPPLPPLQVPGARVSSPSAWVLVCVDRRASVRAEVKQNCE